VWGGKAFYPKKRGLNRKVWGSPASPAKRNFLPQGKGRDSIVKHGEGKEKKEVPNTIPHEGKKKGGPGEKEEEHPTPYPYAKKGRKREILLSPHEKQEKRNGAQKGYRLYGQKKKRGGEIKGTKKGGQLPKKKKEGGEPLEG